MNKRLKKKKYRDLVVKLFEEMDMRKNDCMLIKFNGYYKIVNCKHIQCESIIDEELQPRIEFNCTLCNDIPAKEIFLQMAKMQQRHMRINPEEFIIR